VAQFITANICCRHCHYCYLWRISALQQKSHTHLSCGVCCRFGDWSKSWNCHTRKL